MYLNPARHSVLARLAHSFQLRTLQLLPLHHKESHVRSGSSFQILRMEPHCECYCYSAGRAIQVERLFKNDTECTEYHECNSPTITVQANRVQPIYRPRPGTTNAPVRIETWDFPIFMDSCWLLLSYNRNPHGSVLWKPSPFLALHFSVRPSKPLVCFFPWGSTISAPSHGLLL